MQPAPVVMSLHCCAQILYKVLQQVLILTLSFTQVQETADVPDDGKTTSATGGLGDSSGAKQSAMGGLGANLVSTVRSFLPFVSKAVDAAAPPAAGKKAVKVRFSSVFCIAQITPFSTSHPAPQLDVSHQCHEGWVCGAFVCGCYFQHVHLGSRMLMFARSCRLCPRVLRRPHPRQLLRPLRLQRQTTAQQVTQQGCPEHIGYEQCVAQVKALEAAEAARKKEAQRAAERAQQRQQVEAQKAERLKRAQDAKVCGSSD